MKERILSFALLAVVVLFCLVSFNAGKQVGINTGYYKLDSASSQYDSLQLHSASFSFDTPDAEVIVMTDTVPVPVDVDSAAVFQDYFTRKGYEFTHRDTNIVITLQPYLFNNALDSLHLDYRLLRPTTVNHLSHKRRFGVYAGLFAGVNSITPTIHFLIKEKYQIGVGYNLVDPTLLFGFQYRVY